MPAPDPGFVTVSVAPFSVNVAVTVVAATTVTVQVPVPLQPPPLQPLKLEFPAGVAVSVICVPLETVWEHADPQLIAPSALVTVPDPAPALTTPKLNVGIPPLALVIVS